MVEHGIFAVNVMLGLEVMVSEAAQWRSRAARISHLSMTGVCAYRRSPG
jgi:hypothetical protein